MKWFQKILQYWNFIFTHFSHSKKTSMLKLKALWSRSYWFTCALYHSTRYWISSLAALLHDIKFIHFNSAASLHIYQYLLFICDLYYLKNIWVPLTFLRYFRVNMHSSVTVSPFFCYLLLKINLEMSNFEYLLFSTGKHSWKTQNKYSNFDTSKSISYIPRTWGRTSRKVTKFEFWSLNIEFSAYKTQKSKIWILDISGNGFLLKILHFKVY